MAVTIEGPGTFDPEEITVYREGATLTATPKLYDLYYRSAGWTTDAPVERQPDETELDAPLPQLSVAGILAGEPQAQPTSAVVTTEQTVEPGPPETVDGPQSSALISRASLNKGGAGKGTKTNA